MKKQAVYASPVNGARIIVDSTTDPRNVKMVSDIRVDGLEDLVPTEPTIVIKDSEVPVKTYLEMKAKNKDKGKVRRAREGFPKKKVPAKASA